jgi:hypothetical protein
MQHVNREQMQTGQMGDPVSTISRFPLTSGGHIDVSQIFHFPTGQRHSQFRQNLRTLTGLKNPAGT